MITLYFYNLMVSCIDIIYRESGVDMTSFLFISVAIVTIILAVAWKQQDDS